MCFSVIAGRKTTLSGAVLAGANDDWPGCPGHTHFKKHAFHTENERFLTVKGAEIAQAAETYAYTYTACAYETGTWPISWADGMNENQVSVGMVGVYEFRNCQTEKDLLEADDITLLLLERGSTARQAIETVGALIEEHGFTVSSIDGAAGTVCIAVADPQEGFFLELVPGGHWVAKRVADDEVECRPNCFGTQEIDFSDTENFLCSPRLRSYALENGLWQEGEAFNFSKIYGAGPRVNDTYGGAGQPVNQMRRWDCLHTLCGVDTGINATVYCAKPLRKLAAGDIMRALTSTLEGTPYDLSLSPEAGMYHNPLWMTTSTSVGQGGTVVSMVYDFRPDDSPASGCMWVACSAAKLSVYVPVFTASEGLPEEYGRGECGEYDLRSAWWAFQEVGELCYRRYEEIAGNLVRPAYNEMQREFLEKREALYARCASAAEVLEFSHSAAEAAYNKAIMLGKYIKGKYLCNTVLSWL